MSTTQTNPGGLLAYIAAIQAGSFKPINVSMAPGGPLSVVTPWGTFIVSNFMYLSDASSEELASLLGGKVVKQNPSGQNAPWMPIANYIQLSDGSIANAAALSYYANYGKGQSATQLAFNITQTFNQNTAIVQNGGNAVMFPLGWAGPEISALGAYPPGQVLDSVGNLVNPAWIF